MNPGTAHITFDFRGQRYDYDGGLPDSVINAVAELLDDRGFWLSGYPADLFARPDPADELPVARWEIEHIGGTIVQIHGARADGSIHWEDWQHPRIH